MAASCTAAVPALVQRYKTWRDDHGARRNLSSNINARLTLAKGWDFTLKVRVVPLTQAEPVLTRLRRTPESTKGRPPPGVPSRLVSMYHDQGRLADAR